MRSTTFGFSDDVSLYRTFVKSYDVYLERGYLLGSKERTFIKSTSLQPFTLTLSGYIEGGSFEPWQVAPVVCTRDSYQLWRRYRFLAYWSSSLPFFVSFLLDMRMMVPPFHYCYSINGITIEFCHLLYPLPVNGVH